MWQVRKLVRPKSTDQSRKGAKTETPASLLIAESVKDRVSILSSQKMLLCEQRRRHLHAALVVSMCICCTLHLSRCCRLPYRFSDCYLHSLESRAWPVVCLSVLPASLPYIARLLHFSSILQRLLHCCVAIYFSSLLLPWRCRSLFAFLTTCVLHLISDTSQRQGACCHVLSQPALDACA